MRRIWSVMAVAAVAGGVQIGLAPSSHADTGVSVTAANLHVTAAAGKANKITVSLSPQGDVVVTDAGDVLRPGGGCTRGDGGSVVCPGVQAIQVDLKDLDDTFTNATGIGARVEGGPGADTVLAGSGGDVFTGGPGDDVFTGGAGDDSVVADRLADGADVFTGGPGDDTAVYRDRLDRVTVSLDDRADDGAAGERDDIRADVENVRGGAAGDTVIGNDRANEIRGGRGDDTLDGGGGDDTLNGEAGKDVLAGEGGGDLLLGLDGAAGDDLDGGAGNDECRSDAGDVDRSCET
ncbi:hypothetical protein GCM10010466_01740 [Planomonospora alba]|uniref:Calcium-binding protein n=1 Tax=Planomonospora alba TaxID=161354 RepID=A0ABP6MHR3_9ACTN